MGFGGMKDGIAAGCDDCAGWGVSLREDALIVGQINSFVAMGNRGVV
ncbi:hypothetical protein RISK_000379 [Rhodopirellula islandica]|uniref:Uncharacterized protein n=2 Tax=Rhodopirellula islandica TaxID=595434 RepID=A0A0J1BL85_RHOIS|nr:hypothetical protein RISK_000379 [Rhodopirellula islandica]